MCRIIGVSVPVFIHARAYMHTCLHTYSTCLCRVFLSFSWGGLVKSLVMSSHVWSMCECTHHPKCTEPAWVLLLLLLPQAERTMRWWKLISLQAEFSSGAAMDSFLLTRLLTCPIDNKKQPANMTHHDTAAIIPCLCHGS